MRAARAPFTAATACILLAACGGEPRSVDDDHHMAGAVASDFDPQPDARTFETLTQFVDGYWNRPIPPQGDAPEAWSDLEASLAPEDCAACHPDQFEDWRTTVHSGAYSPGLSGQLVNWEQGAFGTVQSCLVCHAPLSEQSARLPDGTEWALNPDYDPGLRNHGIVCAACHVRGHTRHGPPRRDGSVEPSPEGSPHGGVRRTTYFEDSRFCSGCHQFGPGGAAPNGKPLENTYVEWAESRYADEGIVCQTCHMPDRRHLWRGIHDPDMVRSGITVDWIRANGEAGLLITNTGTGHRFPTYATPDVLVRVEFLDREGRPLEASSLEHSIARRIAFQAGAWVELSDTRLAPDSSVRVAAPAPAGVASARATITVRPDAFYLDVFAALLSGMRSDTSEVLLSEAHRRAEGSPFIIFDEAVTLDP